MVNIYEYNEIDFNHRGTPLKNFLKCEITEALNGVYELNFEYPLESDDSHLLENGKVLKANNYDGEQLFRILYLQKDLDTIKGYALHISYDLLGNFIEDIYLQGMNGTRALQEVLNRSTDPHNFVGVSNITKLRNSRLVRKNTLEAIMGDKDNSLLSRWGGELYRDNFRINWLEKIGSDKGVTIKYAKNLTGIEYKIDLSHLVTHFIPKGFDGLLLPEKYVVSPLAEKYKPIVKRKLLELEDVKSKKVSPTQEDAVDHDQALTLLREKSKKAFELGADKPEITCTVAFIDLSQTEEYKNYAVLEKIYLGDTVGVQYKGINILTRCVGYTYDCLQNRYIHVELGNTPQQNLLANAINNQQALITKIEEVERSNVEKAKEAIKDSLNDGLGSNIKYYSDRILIMDTNNEATAKVVWKFNSNGLSVSTTGVNGNFRLATTKDGKFFAEIITGLKINSEMIETGAIDFKHLSSTVFSKVREGLITESKLSEFLITNEGLKQKLTEEVQRQIEAKKPELKGKDGKVPAFNQLIGTRFPSLDVVKPVGTTQLKLNKKDYNTQNSIEVLPNANNELQGFNVKVNIRDIAPGRKYMMRIPIYVFSDSGNNTEIKLGFPNEDGQFHLWFAIPLIEVPKGENKWFVVEKEMPIGSDTEVQRFVKSNFAFISTGNAHFKIAEPYIAVDDVRTDKWLPAIEDMQSYSLTASARIEGSYLNENLMNCKVYLDVYSNGEIVRASTNEIPLKIEIKKLVASGYTATGEVTLDSNGLVQNINIPNGTKDGQPIEVVFEVTCGENKTVASARLNNTIDKQLLTETISKVKTFESTIDKFESKIGEINKQKFKMAYNIENICSESGVEKKGNDLYFNAKTPLKKDKEYYILADLEDVPDNQNTRLYNAKGNGDNKAITNGLNVWRVSYTSDQTKVNIYPLGANTKVKNVEIYEVPEFEAERIDIINYSQGNYNGNSLSIYAKGKLEISKIYTLEFEVVNTPPQGSFISMYENTNTKSYFKKKTLVKGINKLTFRNNTEYNAFGCTIKENLQIRNVKFYKEDFNVGYKDEYNISEMESAVKQTKSEVELSVKKDKVINSINLSGEGVKINADKVDISGTLSAYNGKIGTFYIGDNKHANYGKWITGVNQFQIGMSDGTNGAQGTALWVNWGDKWNVEGKQSWYVMNNGAMIVNNRANINALFVTGDSYFSRRLRAQGDGVDVGASDVFGTVGGANSTVIWWGQIERVKSAVSDKRLKENIQPTKVNALDTLNQIEMVEFNWKKDGKFEKIGAIAQQVENVDESLVVQHFEDKDTPTDYLRINYYDTIPYLIKAVQELSEKVENLEEQLKERSKKDGI
jgi:phage minor structural protein